MIASRNFRWLSGPEVSTGKAALQPPTRATREAVDGLNSLITDARFGEAAAVIKLRLTEMKSKGLRLFRTVSIRDRTLTEGVWGRYRVDGNTAAIGLFVAAVLELRGTVKLFFQVATPTGASIGMGTTAVAPVIELRECLHLVPVHCFMQPVSVFHHCALLPSLCTISGLGVARPGGHKRHRSELSVRHSGRVYFVNPFINEAAEE